MIMSTLPLKEVHHARVGEVQQDREERDGGPQSTNLQGWLSIVSHTSRSKLWKFSLGSSSVPTSLRT